MEMESTLQSLGFLFTVFRVRLLSLAEHEGKLSLGPLHSGLCALVTGARLIEGQPLCSFWVLPEPCLP